MRWLCVTSLLAAGGTLACTDSARDSKGSSQSASARVQADTTGDASRGRALVTAFRDSLPEHSGNGLRCTSCHLDEGKRPTALPWLGTAARYPQYRARPGINEPLTQRVNECIARSLAGQMLPERGRDMRDILAYLETLRSAPKPPAPPTVELAASEAHGRQVFTASCARCHGANGEGLVAPAVWGANSYSIGAGLARQYQLATFVHSNMPYDSAGVLSAQDAADVAAYVLSHPRQDHPGKERDWPKGDPPVDVAYATDAARAAGKPVPAPRPLLPRRVMPRPSHDSATTRLRGS
jgi:thiosulfate dehydrogenase